jgi:hypothetical protein
LDDFADNVAKVGHTMRFRFLAVSAGLLLTIPVSAFATPRVHRGPTAPHAAKSKTAKAKASTTRGIEPERATQIQTALIKAGYLSGTPSGVWDAQSEAAMQKLQADNGWQTKLVPDSRAIIKLGLGPNNANNAEAVAPETAAGVSEPKAESGQSQPFSR